MKLEKALKDVNWISHCIGDNYTMDGKKDIWQIVYYPIFEDGRNGDLYDEPRALIEKPMLGKLGEKIGTDFREVPLRYLIKCK